MATCDRCGTAGAVDVGEAGQGALSFQLPTWSDYSYCRDCLAAFAEVYDHGVVVRSYHELSALEAHPYKVFLAPTPDHDPQRERVASTQVEALRVATGWMNDTDSRGLFVYNKTGSAWFVDEYLDAHPKVAADVEASGGLIGRLLG